MKTKAASLTALAVAASALVVACGGGGGGGGTAPSLQLNGVAATGLALANSPVDVKCASGTGTATTNDAGSYTVSVPDGQLPCIVRVTGMADGVPVTLHSLAEGSGTSATVNVTPLTELILARATGTLPAALYEDFSAGAAPTGTALETATTEVLAALGDATGIDLGGVDPFKGTLVAATSSDPTGGNGYDQLLDQLGAVVTPAMLPQVVSQIAGTATAGAPVTLEQVVANVKAGSLQGCPQALSGKYRLLEYTGAIDTVDINFGTMKLTAGPADSPEIVDLVPNPANPSQPCEFLAQGGSPTVVVIGPTGAGAFSDAERVGYIFPLQAHSFASVQGKWDFLESGIEETNLGVHFIGHFDIAADGKATVCEYDVMNNDFSACEPDTAEAVSLQEHTGGSFVLNYGTETSPVYGFRAPNGSLTLYGSNNPNHITDPGSFRTHFVLTRPQPATVQAVGTVTKYWDVQQTYVASGTPSTTNGTLGAGVTADSNTVTAATESTVTRTRASDGREDTLEINKPIEGLRYRAPSAAAAGIYQRFLPGLGISTAMDAAPARHFYSVSVVRP